jgi:branched-chain amino acid transport system permease protein
MATTTTAPASTKRGGGWQRFFTDRSLFFIGLVVLAFAYPLIDKALGINRLGSFEAILVYVILAMGLNIVVGYAGLLDLGYAAFFAIGAYTMAFLTSPSSFFIQRGWIPEFMQNFWPAMAVSWVVAAIFGVILGAPTLRLRGDYLAIVTLGFGEIVPNFFLNADAITGGTQGLNLIGKPSTIPLPGGRELAFGPTDQRNWYWLMLVVVLFTLFLSIRFVSSRLGRSWIAIREDEIAAASMGINLVRTKLWAFAMGASFAGFAGSVYASAFQYVHPDQFLFSVSVMVLAMVILGGMGNVYGVILGAVLIGGFDRILAEELNGPVNWLGGVLNFSGLENHDVGTDRFLVFGLALVIMMLVRPEGLLPSQRRRRELHEEDIDEGIIAGEKELHSEALS